MRGGAGSADHVDILGNEELLCDVLALAAVSFRPPRPYALLLVLCRPSQRAALSSLPLPCYPLGKRGAGTPAHPSGPVATDGEAWDEAVRHGGLMRAAVRPSTRAAARPSGRGAGGARGQ